MITKASLPCRTCHRVPLRASACALRRVRRSNRLVARAEEPDKGQSDDRPVLPIDANTEQQQQPEASIENAAELQLPKETIERIKMTVFGFDTFWVTSVENYKEDGVVFKGNMRGSDTVASFKKMKERMKAELGDKYELFLMEDREDRPTAVVLPSASIRENEVSTVTEVWLAALFGLCTVVTTMNANGVPLLEFLIDPFHTAITNEDVADALPGAVAFWTLLGIHELGHWQAAGKSGAQLCLPFFVPAGFGFLGSFGTITRFKGVLPDRQALLDVSLAGPQYGAIASLGVLIVGFILTAMGGGQFELSTAAFADSALVGLGAQAFLGELLSKPTIPVNGLLMAGWAGLIVNALNCVPAGELDGGRIGMALWGRKAANIVAAVCIVLMSGAAISGNALALYWVLLILFLQRGPVTPCSDELNVPRDVAAEVRGALLLSLPLLVLLPYPFDLVNAIQDLMNPESVGGSLL